VGTSSDPASNYDRSTKRKVTDDALLYIKDSGRLVVGASNDGASRHPARYLNLVATPRARVQTRGESLAVEARTAGGEERAALWRQLVAMYPNYDRDQRRTEREFRW